MLQRCDTSVNTSVAQMERGSNCLINAKIMPNLTSLLPSASCLLLLFTALAAMAFAAGDVLYVDSPALPSQGHRKQFLSIRHHLCSHRFFQTESRGRSRMQNIFSYIWKGVEMELGILAATTSIVTASDAAYVSRFEALIFASIRNYSKSDTERYSHCVSEVCQFTDLMCVVNGQASKGTVYEPLGIYPLQSVLVCDIKANASTDFVITLSSPADSLRATLHLCALNRSAVVKVVGCAQPWMDAHSLERRYPGLHRAYLLFVLPQTSHERCFCATSV
jgi:hypothetical protein